MQNHRSYFNIRKPLCLHSAILVEPLPWSCDCLSSSWDLVNLWIFSIDRPILTKAEQKVLGKLTGLEVESNQICFRIGALWEHTIWNSRLPFNTGQSWTSLFQETLLEPFRFISSILFDPFRYILNYYWLNYFLFFFFLKMSSMLILKDLQ